MKKIQILLVLIFCMWFVGCASTPSAPPNYYNLENISEDNYAMIRVSNVGFRNITTENHSAYISMNEAAGVEVLKINGQGTAQQWKPTAIVRVSPGRHTFTRNLVVMRVDRAGNRRVTGTRPVSITHNCKAGYGYSFDIAVRNGTSVEISVYEHDIDQDGSWSSNMRRRRVAKETSKVSF